MHGLREDLGPPLTDIDDRVLTLGLELVYAGDGSAHVVRHDVLASGETRKLPSGATEYQSWHGPWVLDLRGCGNAVRCPECLAERRRRVAARFARKVVSDAALPR